MGWKYTLERLKKNPNVAHIYNSTLVECICGKRIALHRAYEETNLTKHLQSGCNLKNKQPGITNFFKYNTSKPDESADESEKLPVKRKPCQGLSDGKYQQYIERTPVEVGGTRRREVIAKDLFPGVSKLHSKHLSKEQTTEFNKKYRAEAKWIVDRIGNYHIFYEYLIDNADLYYNRIFQ